jgi:hypothetical protein
VPTSQKKNTVTNTSWLMLFGKRTTVYCKEYLKVKVKINGTYNNHCASRG